MIERTCEQNQDNLVSGFSSPILALTKSRTWAGHIIKVVSTFVNSMNPIHEVGNPCFSINLREALCDGAKMIAIHISPPALKILVPVIYQVTSAVLSENKYDCSSMSKINSDRISADVDHPVDLSNAGDIISNTKEEAFLPPVSLSEHIEACNLDEEESNDAPEGYAMPKDQSLRLKACTHWGGGAKATALLIASSRMTAAAAGPMQETTCDFIEISDVEALGKIGHDPNYPLDANYKQVADIDARNLTQSIGNKTHPFAGRYDGNCHTISNLERCFVKWIDYGAVKNVRFSNATIKSSENVGTIACEVTGMSTISSIDVENANVQFHSPKPFSVERSSAAIGVGRLRTGKLENLTAVGCQLSASGDSPRVGIGVGTISEWAKAEHTTAVSCKVTVSGDNLFAGIATGVASEGVDILSTQAVNCKIDATGSLGSSIGIGAGIASVGVNITDTKAFNSELSITGEDSKAGIGAGYVNSAVVEKTMANNCTVSSHGTYTASGVGAGYVWGDNRYTTAINCSVLTSGKSSCAGIGGGTFHGNIDDTIAVRCNVSASGIESSASVEGTAILETDNPIFKNTISVSTSVNGHLQTKGDITENQLHNLCNDVESPFFTSDCLLKPIELKGFLGNNCPESDACSVHAGLQAGIVLASIGGAGIAAYSSYQWFTGYRNNLRGQELLLRPLNQGREQTASLVYSLSNALGELNLREQMETVRSSVANSFSSIMERMRREPVAVGEPANLQDTTTQEMSSLAPDTRE